MTGKLLKSRRIYDGKILHLRVDDVRLPNGRLAKREIIEHPGAVAIVPFEDPDTIIMIKQLRHTVNGWLLEIPAGTLERDETPHRCAARELLEETGYKAGRMMRLFSCYVAPGYSNELIHEFLAADLKYAGQRTDTDEYVKTVRMNLREVSQKLASGTIKDAKTICGMLYVLRRYPEISRWLRSRR